MLKQARIVRETNKRLGLSQEGKAPFFHQLMRLTLTTAESIPTQPSVPDAPTALTLDAIPDRKLALSTVESGRERKLKRQAYY